MTAKSVLGFAIVYPTYVALRPLFPDGANGAIMSGAAVGLAFSALALPLQLPIFPETLKDESRFPPTSNLQKIARATIGNAAFFALFEGCRAIVRKANKPQEVPHSLQGDAPHMIGQDDVLTHATNFFSGGLAGMVFLAVSTSIHKTPVELDWRLALRTVPRVFVCCGAGTFGIGIFEQLTGRRV